MIKSIWMSNWRGFDRERFDFDPGITFLMGPNGHGKTSILEAINYAFTGEATVTDRKKMLRNLDRRASVRLSFNHAGQQYEIRRSQSAKRAEAASMKLLRPNRADEILASSHRGVTAEVEKLLGVSADFLGRIVYMSEGDVFRFLSRPPRAALDQQIRRVLGLTELDEFMLALSQTKKEISDHIRIVQEITKEADRLADIRGGDPNAWQTRVDKDRQERLADLRYIEEKIANLRNDNEALLKLQPLIKKIVEQAGSDKESQTIFRTYKFSLAKEKISETIDRSQAATRDAEKHIAQIEGQKTALQQTLELLSPFSGQEETLPCPVCGKPLTSVEKDHIVGQIRTDLDRLEEDQMLENQRLQGEQSKYRRLRPSLESMQVLRNILTHLRSDSMTVDETIEELNRIVSKELSGFESELATLYQQRSLLDTEIKRLDDENAEFVALQQRLSYQTGYESVDAAKKGLIDLETRLLTLRAAEQAANEVLTDRRNLDMDPIYMQVSKVWGAFAGGGDWKIELDQKGIPIIDGEDQRQLDLSQFSGGEKTALLVIIHTIIAQHFSDTDFLLIDEPLEHLDAVNRRSLIQFLVNAYRRGRFRQAIVATFEESLIRKYMSDEDVNVIHL